MDATRAHDELSLLEAELTERLDAPAHFLAKDAAAPRTLVDILDATVRKHPDELALDDGVRRLTYRALDVEVGRLRSRLAGAGVGRGDRVGVRVPSGTNDLYVAILAVLSAGATYVPVDAEDPDERAELVFGEAGVRTVIGAGHAFTVAEPSPFPPGGPDPRTTRGSSSRPVRPGGPRASPSATAAPPRSWTRRPRSSSPRIRSGPATG